MRDYSYLLGPMGGGTAIHHRPWEKEMLLYDVEEDSFFGPTYGHGGLEGTPVPGYGLLEKAGSSAKKLNIRRSYESLTDLSDLPGMPPPDSPSQRAGRLLKKGTEAVKGLVVRRSCENLLELVRSARRELKPVRQQAGRALGRGLETVKGLTLRGSCENLAGLVQSQLGEKLRVLNGRQPADPEQGWLVGPDPCEGDTWGPGEPDGRVTQPPSSADVFGSVLGEDLREMTEKAAAGPCPCGGDRRDVRDEDGQLLGRYCRRCDSMAGVDDSMDMDDVRNMLGEGQVRTNACGRCSNDDVNRMLISRNLAGQPVLECASCGHQQLIPRAGEGAPLAITPPQQDDPQLTCKTCKNKDGDLFQVGYDQAKKVIHSVRCLVCSRYAGATRGRDDGYSPERERMHTVQDLRPGDHIAWQRGPLSFRRHAIVVRVSDAARHTVRVVLNAGPGRDGPARLLGGEVREEWRFIDPAKEKLYRMKYDEDICYPPEVVLERARAKVGEKHYNLLTNNCEHLVRSCKLGENASARVESFKTTLCRLGKDTFRAFIVLRAFSGFLFTEGTAGMLLATVEVIHAARAAGKAYGRYQRSGRDPERRRELVKVCVTRGSQAAGAVAGSITGGVVGSFAIPVMGFLGPLLGRTLGYFVGKYLGLFAGKLVFAAVDSAPARKAVRKLRGKKSVPHRRLDKLSADEYC